MTFVTFSSDGNVQLAYDRRHRRRRRARAKSRDIRECIFYEIDVQSWTVIVGGGRPRGARARAR